MKFYFPDFLIIQLAERNDEDAPSTSYNLLLQRTRPRQLLGRDLIDEAAPSPGQQPWPGLINILGCPDFHGALELFLAVILKVHQLGLAEDEPALLPVSPGQRGGAATLLVQPALLEGLLLGAEPQEGFVLEDAPAAFPGVHEATCLPRVG